MAVSNEAIEPTNAVTGGCLHDIRLAVPPQGLEP
jgi:hypothetical protein